LLDVFCTTCMCLDSLISSVFCFVLYLPSKKIWIFEKNKSVVLPVPDFARNHFYFKKMFWWKISSFFFLDRSSFFAFLTLVLVKKNPVLKKKYNMMTVMKHYFLKNTEMNMWASHTNIVCLCYYTTLYSLHTSFSPRV